MHNQHASPHFLHNKQFMLPHVSSCAGAGNKSDAAQAQQVAVVAVRNTMAGGLTDCLFSLKVQSPALHSSVNGFAPTSVFSSADWRPARSRSPARSHLPPIARSAYIRPGACGWPINSFASLLTPRSIRRNNVH